MSAVLKLVPPEDDRELVERFRAGERRAFDELVRRHQGSIQRLSLRFLRDAEEARDLAQRAFVQAFERLETFRGEASFRTWVYRITVNLALSQVRKHRPTMAPLEDTAAEADPRAEEERAEEKTLARLRAAVEKLPPKQRLCVELRSFEDLSFREVAEIVGCSEDAAKVNFHHALKRLREMMGEEER
jgi:RNA polymerase sigma-70 factor (ECF subfamily)